MFYMLTVGAIVIATVSAWIGWHLRGESGSWCHDCGHAVGSLCDDCRQRRLKAARAAEANPRQLRTASS